MNPCCGHSFLFLPATTEYLFQTLDRLFKLTRKPSRALNLAVCVASGTIDKLGQNQVCPARRRGPRTPSTTTTATLDCSLVDNALVFGVSHKNGGTSPPWPQPLLTNSSDFPSWLFRMS